MSELIKVWDSPDRVMIHGGTVYSVIETETAIVRKASGSRNLGDLDDPDGEWEIMLPRDPRFAEVPESMRMKACACYDAKSAAEERDKMQKALKGIEAKLRATDPWAAVNSLKGIAAAMPSSST
ncbi:hypothetical protein O8W32_07470 [Methanomassiliicoccales archaeon LGM-DZ1]|nr:hypothetical protein O8W32_07470 [Methanomassiliicoccales archaeon LGM-DZ1]